MKKYILIASLVFCMQGATAQVIIPLLFGDLINENEHIDFGIQGGVNYSNIAGLDQGEYRSTMNLGFYFDIRIKDNPTLYINAGALPLSTMGVGQMAVYPTGDELLDKQMQGGTVRRVLNYFTVPAGLKYMVVGRVFVEGGVQLGLLLNANDVFSGTVLGGNDLEFRKNITRNYTRLDAGLYSGVGYKLPWKSGVYLNARYYWGLVDISRDNYAPSMYNRAAYLMVSFPVGAK